MSDRYFDYNGSTPAHPEVIDEVVRYLRSDYGNPAAAHPPGRRARKAIADARARIANGIGAEPEEIWFTSGGTESNNWALLGTTRVAGGRHLVVSPIEHWSVRRVAEWLAENGCEVTFPPVPEAGSVRVADVLDSIRGDTCLVSVMLANNETGVLQPVREIAEGCHERGVRFHTDATAALGKIPVNVGELGCDLLTVSSHKMYAPKGCGVLFVRKGVDLDPLILGCGQQQGMRSGTENTTGVLAFAKAFDLLARGAFKSAEEMSALRDRLWKGIEVRFPDVIRNGEGESLPNTLSVAFMGHVGAELLAALADRGISVSAGSASTSAAPSHVLKAMGFSDERARSTLRFSLGAGTTPEAIDTVLDALGDLIPQCVSEGKEKDER